MDGGEYNYKNSGADIMININEVKQYTEFLAKKWQSGAVFSPDQFNLTIPNVVRSQTLKVQVASVPSAPKLVFPFGKLVVVAEYQAQ